MPEEPDRSMATDKVLGSAGLDKKDTGWWYVKMLAIVLPVALLAICTAVLFLGNPQSNKYIYMFQAYVLGRKLEQPCDFNGTWRVWRPNGRIESEREFRNGFWSGRQRTYHPNGVPAWEVSYICDEDAISSTDRHYAIPYGFCYRWDEHGELIIRGEYRDGKPWEGICEILETLFDADDVMTHYCEFRAGKLWNGALPVRGNYGWLIRMDCCMDGNPVTLDEYRTLRDIPPDRVPYGLASFPMGKIPVANHDFGKPASVGAPAHP